MVSRDVKSTLLWVVTVSFGAGLVLLSLAQGVLTSRYGENRGGGYVALEVFLHLGEAIVIASIVAFIFERQLYGLRISEIADIVSQYYHLLEFGFKSTYVSRSVMFDEIFRRLQERQISQLKVLGICVSLFHELEYRAEKSGQASPNMTGRLAELIRGGCTVEILFLKRYPETGQLLKYGLNQGDLLWMRDRDEEPNSDKFSEGSRLKIISNKQLGEWIKVYVEMARQMRDASMEDRLDALCRLKLREYVALPYLSLYLVEHDIYVVPYLYKRRCHDVPGFVVTGSETPLYEAYHRHFMDIWNQKDHATGLTDWAVPYEFLKLLANKPGPNISRFDTEYQTISAAAQLNREAEVANKRNPDHYREAEQAMNAVLAWDCFQRGRLHQSHHHGQDAEHEFRKALKLKPEFPEALKSLAELQKPGLTASSASG